MPRTVAARRPSDDTYSARDAIEELIVTWKFPRGRAARIVSIAGTFGIKAEVAPAGGVATVLLVERGVYRITDRMVLL